MSSFTSTINVVASFTSARQWVVGVALSFRPFFNGLLYYGVDE